MLSTNSHDGVVTQHGGLTRVSHGSHVPDELARRVEEEPRAARTGGTYTRFDGRTGEAVSAPSFAKQQNPLDKPNPTGSVMQSIRMEGGNRTVELVPGEPSSRTLLSVALREGLVVETAPGVFSDRVMPGQGPQGTADAPTGNGGVTETDPLEGTIYDRGEFAIWAKETDAIPQHSYDRAVAGATASLATANPAKLDGVISSLAQGAGLEPEHARELVETGIEWYAETISRDLQKSVGMTREQVEDLWDEFRERGHPRLAQAIQEVVTMGRSDVFRELARSYKVQSAVDTDMSAFHKAGYETRVDRATGDILVRRGQGEWTKLNELRRG